MDLWSLSLDPPSKPVPFLQTAANEQDRQFSPQSRWVAYTSDESGREEVYLRTFPDAGERVPVSSTGGHSPRWRAAAHQVGGCLNLVRGCGVLRGSLAASQEI